LDWLKAPLARKTARPSILVKCILVGLIEKVGLSEKEFDDRWLITNEKWTLLWKMKK
jgi:hypothetical protein